MRERLLDGVYQCSLGIVNAFRLDERDSVVPIDTETENNSDALLDGSRGAAYAVIDVDHVLVTHCHQDHVGGLAAATETATGVALASRRRQSGGVGAGLLFLNVPPGFLNRILYWVYIREVPDRIPPAVIDH